jgi:hypothetical protein
MKDNRTANVHYEVQYQHGIQCTYIVTLGRVHETIDAVEKQYVLIILVSVYVCVNGRVHGRRRVLARV